MEPWCLLSESFTTLDMQRLEQTMRFVAAFPDKIADEVLRCHEVARAVAYGLGLEDQVQDGYYGTVDHSWIWLSDDTILDPYAVGRFPQVQLVDYSAILCERANYRLSRPRKDINDAVLHQLLSIVLSQRVVA